MDPCEVLYYLKMDSGTSPVHDNGCFILNKRRITDAVLTVLFGSSILNPFLILGPVIPHGTIISLIVTPPC